MNNYIFTYKTISDSLLNYERCLSIITNIEIMMILYGYFIDENGKIIENTEHKTLIDIFDVEHKKLEKFVQYLVIDPHRSWEFNKILEFING